jgi:hypothetical protein
LSLGHSDRPWQSLEQEAAGIGGALDLDLLHSLHSDSHSSSRALERPVAHRPWSRAVPSISILSTFSVFIAVKTFIGQYTKSHS